MLKVKNKFFFIKLFIYSFSFFLFVFTILLLKFNQISKDIDLNKINSNSIFYGLPSVELLRDYQPKELSKIISSDNKVLYEFYDFDSNRDVVDIDMIPQYTIDALIANEDKNFFNHYGIHIPSIFRSSVEGLNARNKPTKVVKNKNLMMFLIFSFVIKIDIVNTNIG